MAMSDDKYTDIVSDGGMDPRNKQSEALDALTELSQEIEKARKQYEDDNDDWWNGLTEQEREDAFYAVCKRIHKAELQDRGSYRYALYDVFGFDISMYGRGMDCG
jgi:hypothetical protein